MKLKKHWPLLLLTAITGVLLFANLGNQYLWQDEAETALLGRRVLEFGYPTAYDGKNLMNPNIRTSFAEDYGWRYHPWGQFYITALSFTLFGESTFTARVLFALLGLINIPLLYILALKLKLHKRIAFLACLLTALSVNYLLLMRQCRYYAPAVFLVLVILIFYLRYRERKKVTDLFVMSAAMVAMGYTVHGMFLPLYAAIFIHRLIFSKERKGLSVFCVFYALVAVSVAPWFLYSESGAHVAELSLARIYTNIEFQVRMINKFIIPAFFFLALYGIRLIFKREWRIHLTPPEKHALGLISAVLLMSMAAFSVAEERNFRYLVYFIPLLAIIQGMILLRLWNFDRRIMVAFVSISLLTGVFNMGRLEFYLPKYLYEITHDYEGPIKGISRFLNSNADAGDTVKIIYGDMPIMFYTDLKVDNSGIYDDDHMPEWIVFRGSWNESLDSKYYKKVAKTYRKHVLDSPDIKWENRPGDLGYHKFWTVKDAPGVIIFERIEE